MRISLTVNSHPLEIETRADIRLLDVLRGAGYFGVKHGCQDSTVRLWGVR